MNAQEALDTLVAHLRAALKAAQEEGAEAMRRSDFSVARKAAERGEAIQRHMDHLEALRRDLPRLVGMQPQQAPSAAAATARAAKGPKTPGREYWLPILRALVEMGGSGAVADVLDRVYRAMEHRLTDADKEMVPSGGDVRWRNTACWARYHMRLEGLLASDSSQGIWEITDKGREYLKAHGG